MTVKTYTFAAAVRIYIERFPARRHNRSADQDARFLEQYLLDPATNPFSNKPVADVTDRDILTFLVSLADRPAVADCAPGRSAPSSHGRCGPPGACSSASR